MITLNIRDLSLYEKQEAGLLEFFLNTSKPIVHVNINIYNRYKSFFSEFLITHLSEGDEPNIDNSVVIAKNEKSLKRFFEARNSVNDDYRFKEFGELFGYPNIAILYFLTADIYGEKYIVNYYGLMFVCKVTEIEQVEVELINMYGLSLTSNKYTKEYVQGELL